MGDAWACDLVLTEKGGRVLAGHHRRSGNGHRWAVKWGPLEGADIGDRGRMDAIFEKHRPAAVMHFAAFA